MNKGYERTHRTHARLRGRPKVHPGQLSLLPSRILSLTPSATSPCRQASATPTRGHPHLAASPISGEFHHIVFVPVSVRPNPSGSGGVEERAEWAWRAVRARRAGYARREQYASAHSRPCRPRTTTTRSLSSTTRTRSRTVIRRTEHTSSDSAFHRRSSSVRVLLFLDKAYECSRGQRPLDTVASARCTGTESWVRVRRAGYGCEEPGMGAKSRVGFASPSRASRPSSLIPSDNDDPRGGSMSGQGSAATPSALRMIVTTFASPRNVGARVPRCTRRTAKHLHP